MTTPSTDVALLSEEVRMIAHNMRSALSVLQVGTELLGRSKVEGADLAPIMQDKITQVNEYCNRLKDISAQLVTPQTLPSSSL